MDKGTQKKSFIVPSIADVFFISIFLYLALAAGESLLADGDTGYHIRAGEYIMETRSVPRQDIFSFLQPRPAWTAHEWLSEVIMASVHRFTGLTGVVLFFAFVIAFVYFLLFRILQRSSNNIFVTIVVVVLVVASSQIHWLARPHIFSLLLMVLWYYLLDEFQYHDRRRLYLLPFVILLWVNLHGGFIIALVLLGVYLIGNVFRAVRAQGEDRHAFVRKAGHLILILAACSMASLLNPYGYHILLFPLKLTSDRAIIDYVSEFQSPNFHEPMLFTYLLFFMIAVFALSKRRVNIIELLLVLLFSYMALYSARYILLFGIIAAPILIRQTDSLFEEPVGRVMAFFRKRVDRMTAADSLSRGYVWPLFTVALVAVFFGMGEREYHFDEKLKPVAAVEFVLKDRPGGNMFNNDEFGDYVIYRAFPEYRVFIDGRLDMYGADMLKEYFKVVKLETGWEDILAKYDINWIFYNTKSALSRFLLADSDWKLIYSDKVATIFVRNIPANGALIEKYSHVLPVSEDRNSPR